VTPSVAAPGDSNLSDVTGQPITIIIIITATNGVMFGCLHFCLSVGNFAYKLLIGS